MSSIVLIKELLGQPIDARIYFGSGSRGLEFVMQDSMRTLQSAASVTVGMEQESQSSHLNPEYSIIKSDMEGLWALF